MLPCCERCASASTCITTSIFISTLVTFIGTALSGLLLILAPEEPKHAINSYFTFYTGILLLLVATVALLLAILGCAAVNCDSKAGLVMYSCLSILVAIIAVCSVTVLFTYTYVGKIGDNLDKSLRDKMNNNNTEEFPGIQEKYRCCGVENFNDWNETLSGKYPSSCCRPTGDENGEEDCTADRVYKQGCRDVLLNKLKIVIDCSFGAGLVGSLMQLTTAFLACYGYRLIKIYENYDII